LFVPEHKEYHEKQPSHSHKNKIFQKKFATTKSS